MAVVKRLLKVPEGSFELEIPRDRDGSFSPQLIKKHQTRVASMDEQIIAMYSKGMTNLHYAHAAELSYSSHKYNAALKTSSSLMMNIPV